MDRIEPIVAKYAAEWPAWGHRKIRAIAAIAGHQIGSESSVKRAMARRNLLQPLAYQAERRQLARARREASIEPPTRRNQVWQCDFTEFETQAAGTWQLGPVCDYVAKLTLASPVTTTTTASDLIAAFDAAEAAAKQLLGMPLVQDCIDPDTGEIVPIIIVCRPTRRRTQHTHAHGRLRPHRCEAAQTGGKVWTASGSIRRRRRRT